MRRITVIAGAFLLAIGITACGRAKDVEIAHTVSDDAVQSSIEEATESDSPDIIKDESSEKEQTTDIADKEEISDEIPQTDEEEEVGDMIMEIGDTQVQVAWEDIESVEALKELVSQNPLSIRMSMYGGFEQVGSIGQNLPMDDKQTTTKAGDIVLYSGNQIVVFYGSNSWSYTRLGSISDKSEKELPELLGHGDVTITIQNYGCAENIRRR